MKKIYMAGPISYNVEEAKEHFDFVEMMLKKKFPKAEIINPLKLHTDYSKEWSYYMRTGIKALMDCTDVCMLDGWYNSKGANIEWELAVELDINVFHE